jgi:hypothetical protein
MKIQKPTIQLTLLKKAKFRLVIELDITITYTDAPRQKINSPHPTLIIEI